MPTYVGHVGRAHETPLTSVGISGWAYMVLPAVVTAFLVTRFGLVAFFAFSFANDLFHFIPITADIGQWYSESGLLAFGALLLIACFGYYTSTLASRDWNWDPLTGEAGMR